MTSAAASPSAIHSPTHSSSGSRSMARPWTKASRQVSPIDRTNVRPLTTTRRAGDADLDVAALLAFLRARHPAHTGAAVEAESGVSRHTVEKWFAREAAPSGVPLLKLIFRYGPDLLRAAYRRAPPWLDAAATEARLAEVDRRLRDTLALLEER